MNADSLMIDTTRMVIDSTTNLSRRDTTYNVYVHDQMIGSGTYTNRFVDAYLGFNTELVNGLFLTADYSLTWVKKTRKDLQLTNETFGTAGSYLPIDEYLDALYHFVALGVEMKTSGFWKIDEFVPRAGLKWTISNVISKRLASYQDMTTLYTSNFLVTKSEHNPNVATMPSLTVGLGMRAGIARLDTRVEIGQWNGVLSGPLGVEGTLTLDFKAMPAKKPKKEVQAPVAAPAEQKVEAAVEPDPAPAPETKQEVKSTPEPAPAPQAKPAEKAAPEPATAPASPEAKKPPAAAPAPAKTEKKP
jgi:hypothetical protein